MSDELIRRAVVILTALAGLSLIVDAPSPVRIALLALFALTAPGLALTRSLTSLPPVERLALAGATSVAILVAVSLALVFFDALDGTTSFVCVATLALLGCGPRPIGTTPDRSHTGYPW